MHVRRPRTAHWAAHLAILAALAAPSLASAQPRPVIERLEPAAGPVGTEVQVIGRQIDPQSEILLHNAPLTVVSRNPGRWVVRIPEGAQSGTVSVRTRWGEFRGPHFRVTASRPAPTVAQMTPAIGGPGTEVTITGENFSARISDVHVRLGERAVVVRSATPTQIVVVVPPNGATGPFVIDIAQAGTVSTPPFTVGAAVAITDLIPRAGPAASRIAIVGNGFSTRIPENRVFLNNRPVRVTAATATRIEATLPREAASGPLVVDVRGVDRAESPFPFTVQDTPTVTGFEPRAAAPGRTVTIRGTSFGRDIRVVAATLGGRPLTVRAVAPRQIQAELPAGATTGRLAVTVNGVGPAQSEQDFTVLVPIRVAGFEPASGPSGTEVTIRGEGFSPAIAENEVFVGRNPVTVIRATMTELKVRVANAASGPIRVRVANNGEAVTPTPFVVTQPPTVSGFEPASGAPGTAVTIRGRGFGTTVALVAVTMGTANLAIRTLADDQIVAVVPTGAVTGPITVSVRLQGSAASSGSFRVLTQFAVTELSPTTGFIGTELVIHGQGFVAGARLLFTGGRSEAARVVSPTEIRINVPTRVQTGPITVRLPDGRTAATVAFTIATPPAGIGVTRLEAACYRPGCQVTLHGHGFATSLAANRVFFGERPVRVEAATAAMLRVSLPAAPGTNRFRVDVRNVGVAQSEPFTIVP